MEPPQCQHKTLTPEFLRKSTLKACFVHSEGIFKITSQILGVWTGRGSFNNHVCLIHFSLTSLVINFRKCCKKRDKLEKSKGTRRRKKWENSERHQKREKWKSQKGKRSGKKWERQGRINKGCARRHTLCFLGLTPRLTHPYMTDLFLGWLDIFHLIISIFFI